MHTTILAEQNHQGRRSSFFSWWMSITRAERIALSSIIAGSIVAMVNSTVWAIAIAVVRKNVIKGKQTHS